MTQVPPAGPRPGPAHSSVDPPIDQPLAQPAGPSIEPPAATGNTWSRQIDAGGAFVRRPTSFRAMVSTDPGARHPVEAGRYHLYVSLACPWAHRTLIVRALKGLEHAIGVDVVHPHLTDRGWSFDTGFAGATGDTLGARRWLRELYLEAAPGYDGVVTVPVLWDRVLGTIVNNESAEIVRMLDAQFDALAARPGLDLYPAALRPEIDAVNDWVYRDINNGVYRCGFAQSQAAYDAAADALFAALERAEAILAHQPFLCGDTLTEADIRLFVTLIRFDAVYHTHFKCNRRSIAQYPAMHRFLARVYRLPGVAATVDLEHVRHHYYGSHRHLNPSGIVPRGPDILGPLDAAGAQPHRSSAS